MKGWRTVLFNGLLVAAAAILHWIIGLDFNALPLHLSPWIITMIIGGANFLLRLITDTPVGNPNPSDQ